jgi:hypothetical protein
LRHGGWRIQRRCPDDTGVSEPGESPQAQVERDNLIVWCTQRTAEQFKLSRTASFAAHAPEDLASSIHNHRFPVLPIGNHEIAIRELQYTEYLEQATLWVIPDGQRGLTR